MQEGRVTTDVLVGTVLAERYQIDSLLGEGGMGRVYAAQHVLMRKRLAVKVLHRQLTQVPEVVQRFEREALAAAHIDHPNIASATDFGKLPDGSIYLVLEFVEGRSLREPIAEGPLPVRRALHIGRQIARALAAAHELSIVHRDLKPENVMLVDKGGDRDFVKVLDFGVAKVPLASQEGDAPKAPITKAGMIYGTPEYMAPEQALGQNVDGRADLYALGVILYELLSGVRPFTGKSQVGLLGQQLTQPAPGFAQRAPGLDVPLAVEHLVLRLLAREVDERCQAAAEVASALDALLLELPAAEERSLDVLGDPLGHAALPASSGSVDVAQEGLRASARLGGASAAPRLASLPSLGQRVVRSLAKAKSLLETPAGPRRLWDRISGKTSRTGRWIVVGLVGAALIAGLLLWLVPGSEREAVRLGQPDEGAPSSPAVSGSFEARLASAEVAGVTELEALAKAEPAEGRVLVALASARAKGGDFEGALEAVQGALGVDPQLNENPRVAGVLFRAAQAPATSAAAFRLLGGPMGSRGADIIYDLANAVGLRSSVKNEARKIVDSAEFAGRAAPALALVLDLKQAKSCEQSRDLLERAREVGDARALAPLKALTQTTGCGPGKQDDCYACLRGDSALEAAIGAIEARSKTTLETISR